MATCGDIRDQLRRDRESVFAQLQALLTEIRNFELAREKLTMLEEAKAA